MNTLFHTLSRGTDKRKIFLDVSDCLRFIHNLFVLNDKHSVNNSAYYFSRNSRIKDIASPYFNKRQRQTVKERALMVNIHAFCLMPNHYHLLLSPIIENGISQFMKKINIGYAKYFNEKYERSGTLFEGRFKRILVKNEAHFIHLPYYIHLNPLDIFAPEWRKRRVENSKQVIKKLESYRWSSHLDYLGIKNFPSVTNREFLLEFFGGKNGYKKSVYSWLENLETKNIGSVLGDDTTLE